MAMRKPSIYGLAPYTFPYVWELSSSVDCAVALACFSVKMVCFFALSAAFVFVVFVAVSLSVEDYRVFFSDVVSGVRRLCRTSRFCLRPLGIFTRVVFQSYCFMSLTLDSRYDVETQGSVHGTTRAWLFHLIQMTWLTTVLPCLTAEMMMPEPRHEPPPPLAQAINWAAVVANRRADEEAKQNKNAVKSKELQETPEKSQKFCTHPIFRRHSPHTHPLR
ncbi:hypothetical protein G7K_1740-t1 [Saitoella complicata NRRL Y-17804]|uniref:Uncharacterized protein n=1 Tax=Saitoella complicata (strain BCRC 22490 / CBS 7301 / JCM 7358 / NBRC 10748 / NRRL Y-17804) TaxID=698492 RepID=A0A0E9NDQ4_SAICN|nr:hypothetical protein G7K_1740-t1 [Saitoella complicata NRRL Y-17804]